MRTRQTGVRPIAADALAYTKNGEILHNFQLIRDATNDFAGVMRFEICKRHKTHKSSLITVYVENN